MNPLGIRDLKGLDTDHAGIDSPGERDNRSRVCSFHQLQIKDICLCMLEREFLVGVNSDIMHM